MLSTPRYLARNAVCFLPSHLLGFLPGSTHLDQVPQQGHPTFFNQQGAVLVSYKVGTVVRTVAIYQPVPDTHAVSRTALQLLGKDTARRERGQAKSAKPPRAIVEGNGQVLGKDTSIVPQKFWLQFPQS